MSRQLIAGNWKMNTNKEQANALIEGIGHGAWPEKVRMVLIPPSTHLSWACHWTGSDPRIHIGAQNCYIYESGAFTGEISAPMIKDTGAEYVIVGHSERRELFMESDQLINQKVLHALGHGLNVIFCLGEKLDHRESGQARQIVLDQLRAGLKDVARESTANLIIAYEPVWAIGTGRTATPAQAQEIHRLIRDELVELWDGPIAENTPILYGGSVKPDNAKELFAQPDIDGGLVGGASLNIDDFLAIANSF